MSRPMCSGSACGDVPARSMLVRLQFDASACTGSRWVTTNVASGCTAAMASSARRWHGHFSAHRCSGAPCCRSRSTRAWYSYASLEVGFVQQVLEVAEHRHRPEHPRVHEGLVEDGQALLRTVDVGEVEGVDLAAGHLAHEARVLDARRVALRRRLGVERRRRRRPLALPRAQHPQARILIEEVLEVRGARARQPGEEDRRRQRRLVDLRMFGDVGVDFDAVPQRRHQLVEDPLDPLVGQRGFGVDRVDERGEVVEEVRRGRVRDVGERRRAFDDLVDRRGGGHQTNTARARISTLARVGTPGGHVGSVNAVCATRTAPVWSLSPDLNTITSSIVMSGK